ncbi:MAG: M24 family metallopeptidase [Candidatus Chisholmbacteria bacterium]|nr:M24 family metallopeptidase [Candidatus Chisholmbacteria bacterium]
MSSRLQHIQAACQITDAAFSYLLTLLPHHLTETQLAYQTRKFFRLHQATTAFPPIIAVNSHAATPHHRPTQRQIRSGDLVLIDIGCRLHGYCSDLTRTIFLGSPTPLQHQVYRIVKRAYLAALKHLGDDRNKPTSEVARLLATTPRTVDVDRAARQVIAAAGYGKYFVHGTGHGVGRRIHQLPKISPKSKNYKLRTGMVITIEPGIYLPHRFGIRLEDTVLITPTGYQLLTHSPFLKL